jgi:hypothetical protein
MSLISRAKNLLGSRNISAALVILPLPATVATASVTINDSTLSEYGTNIYSGAVTSFSDSVTSNTYHFALQIGNGTQTDSQIFGAENNASRSSYLLLSGTTAGSFSVGDTINFSYTIAATLSDLSITQVTYTGYAVITDTSSIIYAGGGYDIISGSGSVSNASLGFSSNSSGLTSSGSTSTGEIGTGTSTETSVYGSNAWQIFINYDWNIEGLYPSSYSNTEILALSISGSLTTNSAVPEPASWSLMGASAAFAAVFLARRKKTPVA